MKGMQLQIVNATAWHVLPIVATVSTIPLLLALASLDRSYEYNNEFILGDDTIPFDLFEDDEVTNQSSISKEMDFEVIIETFLRFCLFLAVCMFLYASVLLQETMLAIGLIRCRRKLYKWNNLASSVSRRAIINI
jgi:hypothetical protein